MKTLLTVVLFFTLSMVYAQQLTIVEQDFDKALQLAEVENKLLFVDFYTTWCGPCKELDKWIFNSETYSKKLAKDFVLLRYDAEKDKKFHLSKKYHVSSYPTAIILNKEGYVVNRKYGFGGEDAEGLSASVFEFTKASTELHQQHKFLEGYANTINEASYPKFYSDFVNRDNLKAMGSPEFDNYWKAEQDRLAEGYFSTLCYFANNIPASAATDFLEKREAYRALYGETDVRVALFLVSLGRFEAAVTSKSQEAYDKAVAFAKEALSEEGASQLISMFKTKFEAAKNG